MNKEPKRKMYEAVDNGTAKILTMNSIESLKGKRIATIYFGYEGQDGVDEFVVGDLKTSLELMPQDAHARSEPRLVKSASNKLLLHTADGRNTYIFHCTDEVYHCNGEFACSDTDRYVYYVTL